MLTHGISSGIRIVFTNTPNADVTCVLYTRRSWRNGIVAMLELSDVDNVCVCLKRSGQFALKRAFIDGSPHYMPSALQGHFEFAEGLAI